MAALQVLRKRYKSIQATADMCSAMKTASSVKYAKISRILSHIEAYSRACDNADKSLERLEILINRIRQSEVTNSVIETSSYLLSE